ncbi:MAG: hypothetical protein C0412_16920, partial [Flavobacterium sp.]|nr:hypothetical protein [Flavobacterium sp.]
AVSFGILHFILYIYNPNAKSNLFFSIFLFLWALSIFFDFQASLSANSSETIFYLRLHRLIMPYNSIFALLFLYYAFDLKIPIHFWLLAAGLFITGFFAVFDPINNFIYVQIPLIFVPFEAIRIFIAARNKKRYDAWIIALGFALLFLFSIYDIALDLNLLTPINNITNGYPFGFLCLIISASIYLARDFARTNSIILNKEREAKELEISRRVLEAEDSRKAKELNDARDLQLSLLPQCTTAIGNYDICFQMKAASEVGGDYYDYLISENGEISLVIGDATDHGMKAGMMVSIIKSLFLTHVENTEIKDFFNISSRTIKKMKLKNLYMALMLIKIKGSKLAVSSAGIPPLLIYRKKTDMIEEYIIKGMPLGAFDSFPYETIEIDLEIGDTVLLMSDGLPDLFNGDNQSFGMERLKEIFLQYTNEPVTDILAKLLLAGEQWMKGCKQNDDITLVVFRLRK